MTEISWMMQEIITVRWAGLLRGEKEKTIDLYQKEEKIFYSLRRCSYLTRKNDQWKRSVYFR